jgi:hypothetical protein
MRYCIALCLAWSLLASIAQAQETAAKRRVYVLHSGMHIIFAQTDKNYAARTMKKVLMDRGIPERDLIQMESPFPTATWSNMIPKEGLVIYLGSADPASRQSREAYERLHTALKERKVTSNDDIIWLGHSAGGQMGMTMAYIAHNLSKFPELAKKTQPYHFDTVITLGTAVGSNHVPSEVKLRHYYSTADSMLYILTKHGNVVSESIESKVRFCPSHNLGSNGKIRVFADLEHADYYTDDATVACILGECQAPKCPDWRRCHADAGCGFGLSQLIARSLESELRISLEEDHH